MMMQNLHIKKAIKQYYPNKFEIHSIGINKKRFPEKYFYKYHQIDLSLSNPNLIEQLKNLQHPDIILASPPCESWSGGRLWWENV